jgi:tRNA(Arg) A34 adenosine deaminase TadA
MSDVSKTPSSTADAGAESKIDRREVMVATAAVVGMIAGAEVSPAAAQTPAEPPPGYADQKAFKAYWQKALSEVVDINLAKVAPELALDAVKERHRIYCHLLMKLMFRFWNGNKRGPFGSYPLRRKQLEASQNLPPTQRYRGDVVDNPGGSRQSWDRYIGHNIACLAVDGNGEIIDFDFNHNEFFRSSAEHAESRLVRRLFSLTNIFDSWKTGGPVPDKPRSASLNEVTVYTSLESCAQCSGVMSLAGVKQVVYLQNDFTAYKIGNIMFNLANPVRGAPGAPIPIPGVEVGLPHYNQLNDAYLKYVSDMIAAEKAPDAERAFYISPEKAVEYDTAITSFLCIDASHDIIEAGGKMLDTMVLGSRDYKPPTTGDNSRVLSNEQCLQEAREFYKYADVEGFRGSPHKL